MAKLMLMRCRRGTSGRRTATAGGRLAGATLSEREAAGYVPAEVPLKGPKTGFSPKKSSIPPVADVARALPLPFDLLDELVAAERGIS